MSDSAIANDDLAARATQALNQKLAEKGLTGVTAKIGWTVNGKDYNGKPQECLQINLSGPAVHQNPESDAAIQEKLYQALKEIDVVRQHVEFDDPAKHLAELKTKLSAFIAKGAKIPESYVQWRGFNKELNGDDGTYYTRIVDHAISPFDSYASRLSEDNVAANGIQFTIRIPETQKEREQQTGEGDPLRKKVTENIKAREQAIKEMIAERLALPKYLGGTMSAEEIKKQVNGLIIEIEGDTVTLLSPQQKTEKDRLKADPKAEPLSEEERKKNAESNILSKLTKEKLGKILGRAFLHAGDKAEDIFPLIAGHEDMARAVRRQLKILKYSETGQKDPELSKSIDEFLADDAFKKHDWKERGKLKVSPESVTNPDPDAKEAGILGTRFTFIDKEGVTQNLLTALAALQPQTDITQTASASAGALGIKPESTAVGAVTPEMQQKALATALKQVEEQMAPQATAR